MTMYFFELFSFVVAAFEIQVGGRAGRPFSNSLKENDCTTCNLVDETTEVLNMSATSLLSAFVVFVLVCSRSRLRLKLAAGAGAVRRDKWGERLACHKSPPAAFKL